MGWKVSQAVMGGHHLHFVAYSWGGDSYNKNGGGGGV